MRWLVFLALLTSPAWAEDKLDGRAITAALTGKSLVYEDDTRQSFRADGETVFNNGRDSIGHWQVKGDRYCSVWPPSDVWACYDVVQTGATVSFVADDGSRISGHVAD